MSSRMNGASRCGSEERPRQPLREVVELVEDLRLFGTAATERICELWHVQELRIWAPKPAGIHDSFTGLVGGKRRVGVRY